MSLLERFLGKQVKINHTEISGEVTDVREAIVVDVEYADGSVYELLPYVEVDGYVQAHPTRVIIKEQDR